MSINTKDLLTDPKRFFLEPSTSAQRQYEALRGFFIEELPSAEAAQRFGYTPGSFRVLVHDFRHDPAPQFFLAPPPSPPSSRTKAFLSSPDAGMTKEWRPLGLCRPMPPRSHFSLSNPGGCAPSSAGFSSFCLSSPRSLSRTSFTKRTSPGPRRSPRTTPCVLCWHSSCSATPDTAMS